MKTMIKAMSVAAIALGLAACKVEQTKEGDLPDVDVNVSEGQLPEFNVQGPDIDVGTTNATVEVPDVDVNTKKTKVELPTVDVKTPN